MKTITPPKEIQFTEVEILKIENIQLKIGRAQETLSRLAAQRQEVSDAVCKRLGIDSLSRYAIDIGAGRGRLVSAMDGETDESVG